MAFLSRSACELKPGSWAGRAGRRQTEGQESPSVHDWIHDASVGPSFAEQRMSGKKKLFDGGRGERRGPFPRGRLEAITTRKIIWRERGGGAAGKWPDASTFARRKQFARWAAALLEVAPASPAASASNPERPRDDPDVNGRPRSPRPAPAHCGGALPPAAGGPAPGQRIMGVNVGVPSIRSASSTAVAGCSRAGEEQREGSGIIGCASLASGPRRSPLHPRPAARVPRKRPVVGMDWPQRAAAVRHPGLCPPPGPSAHEEQGGRIILLKFGRGARASERPACSSRREPRVEPRRRLRLRLAPDRVAIIHRAFKSPLSQRT